MTPGGQGAGKQRVPRGALPRSAVRFVAGVHKVAGLLPGSRRTTAANGETLTYLGSTPTGRHAFAVTSRDDRGGGPGPL